MKIETTLFVVYSKNNDDFEYYKGSTFYNVSEWTPEIREAFFFNHEPRKFELTNILEESQHKGFGMSDILVKGLSVGINQQTEEM